jgi:hypothetical protein
MNRKRLLCRLALILVGLTFSLSCFSQRVGIKTNALYWATASPNLGVEFRLSRHFTLNIEGVGNLLKNDKFKTHTAAVMPEGRYWFSARPQAGHFVGAMGLGSMFQWKLNETNHKGDIVGLGLTYGYSFVLGKRWSLEATLGAGWMHFREIKFKEGEKAPSLVNNSKDLFAPLKAGVTFVYLIK